ncbi:MAG: hypothetical protein A2W28_11780 [Gammaproteobacteria bacterium RBG_16_51_14]|nr:MAG: hypothetical protein A2W28_11780 [Gammaproteobacteria bacterium RBG_16_51_14]
MGDITLRGLAKEYAKGAISKEDYRQARAELITGILSGEIPLEVNEYPSPVAPPELESITVPQGTERAKPKPESVPAPKPVSQTDTEHHWLFIASVVAVLCLAVLLIILLRPAATRQVATENLSSAPQSPSQPAETTARAGQMITEFLTQKNWSTDRLQAFQVQWERLSEEEKTAGHGSSAMRQLTEAVYRRLLEEQALAGIGDGSTAMEKQHNLVNFANAIGIEDARIKTREITAADIPPTEPPSSTPPVSEETVSGAPVDTGMMSDEAGQVSNQDDDRETSLATTGDLPTDTADASQSMQTGISAAQPAAPEEAVPEDSIESAGIEPPQDETAGSGTAQGENATAQPSATEAVMEESQARVAAVASPKMQQGGCRASLLKSRKPFCRDQIEAMGNGPTMVVLPAGEFVMGGNKTSEQPSREVTIASPFAMSVHEITISEFEPYCKATGNACPQQPWSGGDYPVVNITWKEAVRYTEWLTEKTGRQYRLPSEAEWEYAARAGTTTTYPTGDEILITDAVFSDRKPLTNPLPKTDRTINRNKFRLYHMSGNVREWVADSWHDGYSGADTNSAAYNSDDTNLRVVRGGSYQDSAEALRSGAREKMAFESADKFTGFRIVQELPENEG